MEPVPAVGPAAAPGGGDSGVDEGDQESCDSFMSSISVGIAQQAQQQQQLQPIGVGQQGEGEPQPGPSNGQAHAAHPFPAPLPTAQISPPNSTASSISDSTPATPEPTPGSSNAAGHGSHVNIHPHGQHHPPAEDGYLGDCSSDGGNEKNFPMPPDKLERLLCSAQHRGYGTGRRGGVSEGSEAETVDPPAGMAFQNVQQDANFYGYHRVGSAGGGGGPIRRSAESRKMRSSHFVRHRVHNAGAASSGSWSTLKAEMATRKLRSAANFNNPEAVERLLAAGANPNEVDDHKRSPLHFAAAKGFDDIVRVLLLHGADPNCKDALGNTALHLAACTSHVGVVTLLLRAGTNAAELDNHGRTPIQLAQSKLRLLQKTRSGPGSPEMESVSHHQNS